MSTETDGAVYLMDASAFIHRAFHAMGKMSSRSGLPTGAAFGFTATLLRLLKDKRPRLLAVVYDSRGPTRRHELYPEYKANRPPMDPDLAAQQAPIREIVDALGLVSLERPGHEADDVIASMCRQAASEGRRVVIVSGDKDFYQLLSPTVSMYDPNPKKSSALTDDGFRELFPGVGPQGFLEMQALMGDPNDNIPGVPKVGPVTAHKLIAEFGTIDELYGHLDKVSNPKLREKLAANEAAARLSRSLALLGEGLAPPLATGDLAPRPPDMEALRRVLGSLDFRRLLADVEKAAAPGGVLHFGPGAAARPAPGAALAGGPAEGDAAEAPAAPAKPARSFYKSSPGQLFGAPADGTDAGPPDPLVPTDDVVDYDAYVLVDGPEAWGRLEGALSAAGRVSVDLETDQAKPSRANIVGVSLATGANESFYVPVAHRAEDAPNQGWEEVRSRIGAVLEADLPTKTGQHAKFDWQILSRHGLRLPIPADDPMLASYLLDPDQRHGLDALSARWLSHRAISYKDVVPDPKTGDFSEVDPALACRYSAEDADLAWRLAPILRAELAKTPQLERLYDEVELPLEELLGRMEATGVLVDPESLKVLSSDLAGVMAETAGRLFKLAGREFNPASPKQTAEVLFVSLGLPAGKKTAGTKAHSTDNEVLAELAPLYPVAAELMAWREVQKLKTTYADKLPGAINPLTGRVHTSYNQAQTATGRLSSSDPNLQNIPARTEEGRRVRAAFLAPEGWRLVSADYSQIELRVMAHFSEDRAMIKAFEDDEDIHAQTAARIFGLPPDQVPPERRRAAKTINFGIIYGQGPWGLAKQLGVDQLSAKSIIDSYFARFPGVKAYMERTVNEAARTGQVSTWYGRRRFLPRIGSSGPARREAERMAVNTPVQGTAADIIKMAMLMVDRALAAEGLKARIIMQVHDELVIETPDDELEAVKRLVRAKMEEVGAAPPVTGGRPLLTPLRVDVAEGRAWTHA